MGEIKKFNENNLSNSIKKINQTNNININNENINANMEFVDFDIFNHKKNKKRYYSKASVYFACVRDMEKAKKIKRVEENDQYVNYYYDEEGNLIAKYFENTNVVIDYRAINDLNWPKLRYFKYYPEDEKKNHFISIFDDDNIDSFQYGARQEVFGNDTWEIFHNQYIYNEITKYYPSENFESYEDFQYFIEKYFEIMRRTGCGYSAEINTVFREYEGREDDFERIFGFPMYEVNEETGEINFNYEIMFLKYFDYTNAGKYTLKKMGNSVELVIRDDFKEPGSVTSVKPKKFDDFLKDEFDIESDVKKCNIPSSVDKNNNKEINEYLHQEFEENDYLVYFGEGWYLEDIDGDSDSRGSSHGLIIVGFTDDNYPIVSSWGKKYVLHINNDVNSDSEDSKYSIYKVNYYNDDETW